MVTTEQGDSESLRWQQALATGPVLWAWLVAVGVDLFYNAGVLSPLFDQEREPALLSDSDLAARIPVGYLMVGLVVAALAWIVDTRQAADAGRGARIGAGVGLYFGLTGIVYLWTAIDMTLPFVAAGVLVQVSQLAAAGTVFGAVRSGVSRARIRRRCLGAAAVGGVIAVVAQNVLA